MARSSPQITPPKAGGSTKGPSIRREILTSRIKIGAVLAVVVAIIGFSAKPAYNAFREGQINKNLEAAKEAIRLEDWGTARDRARSVLLARKNDFEAYRIWTRALGKMGEPRTYMAAATLFMDPRSSDADKNECLRVMALQAPQSVALSAFASLPAELRDQAEFRAAISPVFVARGLIEVGERGLRENMGERPAPAVRLELIRYLCARPNVERINEARTLFSDLIAADADEQALEALELLGNTPGGLAPGSPLPPSLPDWVRSTSRPKTMHHLLALHPEIEEASPDNEVYFTAAIERFSATDAGILGTWLIRHNRWQQALSILDSSVTGSEAYIAKLHALIIQGDNQAISKALADVPPSADMVEVELVAALVASKQGDKTRASAAWSRALNHAGFDTSRNRFIEVARFAELNGASDAKRDAWVGAVRSGWGTLPLYADLLDVFGELAVRGRSEDLLSMYRSLMRLEPYNADVANNFNYLGLIHGILQPEQTIERMTALIDANPDKPEFRSALMLAQMMAGTPEEALKQLEPLRHSKRISPMMMDSLEGSALVLTGKQEEGVALLARVNWRQFMRQERIVFRDLLLKLKVAQLPMPDLEDVEVEVDPESVPAWRKAVEQSEKDRSSDILPALPAPVIPGNNLADPVPKSDANDAGAEGR